MASAGTIFGSAGQGAAGGAAFGGIGAPVGAVIGGLMGALSGGGHDDEIRQNMQDALNKLQAIGMPPNLAAPIIFQRLQDAGQLDPRIESILQEELFNASQVEEPVDDRTAMLSALNQMRAQTFGGLTPEQMANQQKLLNQVNAAAQSQFKGILQGQQQRGQLNAGDTLASQLQAAQSGAQRNSENALQIGAQGSQAQREAINALFSGQSNLRQQDIAKAQANAQLKQSADIWKAQNASGRQARNVDTMNKFDMTKWDQQNRQNMYNTGVQNQELLRQRNAERDYWNDKLRLAQAQSGALQGNAGWLTGVDQNNNQSFNTMMQGLTSGAAAYGGYQNNQNQLDAYNRRTNVLAKRNPASDNWSGFYPDTNAGGYGEQDNNTYKNPYLDPRYYAK